MNKGVGVALREVNMGERRRLRGRSKSTDAMAQVVESRASHLPLPDVCRPMLVIFGALGSAAATVAAPADRCPLVVVAHHAREAAVAQRVVAERAVARASIAIFWLGHGASVLRQSIVGADDILGASTVDHVASRIREAVEHQRIARIAAGRDAFANPVLAYVLPRAGGAGLGVDRLTFVNILAAGQDGVVVAALGEVRQVARCTRCRGGGRTTRRGTIGASAAAGCARLATAEVAHCGVTSEQQEGSRCGEDEASHDPWGMQLTCLPQAPKLARSGVLARCSDVSERAI